jgi:hypothetical protein
MPIRVNRRDDGGESYIDVRVGEGHTIHQVLLNVEALQGAKDSLGFLPPGLPIKQNGTPVGTDEQTFALIGPEPIEIGETGDIFANAIYSGGINRKAVEDNLDRTLTAAEQNTVAAIRLL